MGKYPNIELGVGLLKLGGREWGGSSLGSSYNSREFLHFVTRARRSRFLDTAPAYDSGRGSSEEALGSFLRFHKVLRQRLIIATKFGEKMMGGQSIVDHSKEALRASLDKSINRLGTVPDVLFVHKTTTALFDDPEKRKDLDEALRYAKRRGVGALGASVSDVQTAQRVLADKRFRYIQFPLNTQKTDFEEVVQQIAGDSRLRRRMTVVINRPFGEGQVVKGLNDQEKNQAMDRAFGYIRDKVGQRVKTIILTGASSPEHYSQNIASLRRVTRQTARKS